MTTKECQRCADFLDDDNVEKAAWYCPDCPDDRQLLCSKCCGLEHHVGTQSENHSFEELDVNRSCHLFSAVFDAMTFYLSLALGLRYMYLLWHIGNVWQPYLDGHDVCPLTAKVRTWWASWDTGLLYLAKLVMVPNSFCAWEDGYWRIYADMWIRSIVTDTDGWFLMISVLPRAFWFHFAFVWVLAPFIVVAHALLSAAVNAVELRLAARLLDRKQEPGKIAQVLHTLNDKIAPRAPPATKPRARRMINFVDGMSYWLRRRMRNVSFYYYKASARLGFVTCISLFCALFVRLLCIGLGVGWLFRLLLSCLGFRPLLEAHASRFGHATKDELSEHLFLLSVEKVVGVGLMGFLRSLINIQVVGSLLVVGVIAGILFKIQSGQTAKFKQNWKKNGERDRCLEPVPWAQCRIPEKSM